MHIKNPINIAVLAILAWLSPQFTFGQNAYIPNSEDNTVSVISLASNTVIATIPVGTTPQITAVSLDGTTVYIGNTGSNSVSVINTTSNTVTATISLGFSPAGICVSPNGRKLYVTNQANNSVRVINTLTNSVITNIPVGDEPKGITITPNGKKIYVTNFVGGTISVIDSTTNAVSATILYFGFPYGICMHPDGTKAYATNTGSGVAQINTSTDYISYTLSVPEYTNQVAISASGTRMCSISALNNSATIIDPNPIYPLYTANVSNGPSGVDLSPDGSKIYVTSLFGNFVKVISTLTYETIATIPVGNAPMAFGKFIASNQTVGIAEDLESYPTLQISPNPFSESTTIQFNQNINFARVQIRNVLGSVVRDFTFSGSTVSIDKEDLQAGVYFLTLVIDEKQVTTERIIIK
jgi:YVTN family beta-propeller protein